ncbi:E3 ubiquitin-protein ligase UHRF1-like isoform X2 [Coccinella septempunctata]|nr:E3 ubiquitin-protein ligase UHRF1-like isoform X2 [Coccinella septempunctata]
MFRVRRVDSKPEDSDLVVFLPRSNLVADLRSYIKQEWGVEPKNQKLYYQGKELIDQHKLIEYKIKRNHTIQLMVKASEVVQLESEGSKCNDSNSVVDSIPKSSPSSRKSQDNTENLEDAESKFYNVGDPVDYRMGVEEGSDGAWFESEIIRITKNPTSSSTDNEGDLIFHLKVLRYNYMTPFKAKFEDLRPRSFYTYDFGELKEGMKVLANVNMDEPKSRGYWYDVEIKKISKKSIDAVAFVNRGSVSLECNLYFINEILRIEKPVLITAREDSLPVPPLRTYVADCTSCNDNRKRDCKRCGCHTCGKKDRPEELLLCDECNMGFHISCLDPPLEKIPEEDEWFCPECKNDENAIVRAGESLKGSKKRDKMPATKQSGREWDNGMACAGRTKECTIVPKNHFGPIPGVDVGTIWKYRSQVSEAGIHRPLVAGIHGKSSEGAYSIVVSGGYEDDDDNGDEFEYTGAGGRDLTGNKRVNGQTCDQKLTLSNKALALCCNAKFNEDSGAEASDWRAGKPVRVVRKHGKSKYAPSDGYRYDGIYKVVKYFSEKGKSGFMVWKYTLRRDDPSPAPWTKDAPVFDIIYPSDYLEIEEAKKKKKALLEQNKKTNNGKKEKDDGKKGLKRKQ